jgi:membrane-associated phospholipid phosphatase
LSGILAGAAIGLLGVASGLAWRTPPGERFDRQLFQRVNHAGLPSWFDWTLRAIRPFGMTWAFVVLAAVLAIWRPVEGLSLLAVGLVSSGIERAIKVAVHRRRPFSLAPDAVLRLPAPGDPSFPSGDASRAWYLATAAAAGLTPLVPLWASAYLLASLVSLSRVRGGVHFPLDAWAGSCLGLGMGLIWGGVYAWLRTVVA